MATSYLDPNLNNAFLEGSKSALSAGGSDRTMAGSVDRVLKVFHHFETNTEDSIWSSNIRYGDATDVRVRRALLFLSPCVLKVYRLSRFLCCIGFIDIRKLSDLCSYQMLAQISFFWEILNIDIALL